MKINLGCGDDVRDGYCNVDIRRTRPQVIEMDLSKFPWDFDDGCADEIMMLDFLEHFPYRDTKRILIECYRVLKAGGSLVIQVPDATILGDVLGTADEYQCNKCGHWMDSLKGNCDMCGQTVIELQRAAMMRMFGGQDYPGNFHQACFTTQLLSDEAGNCGFQGMTLEEVEHQSANWNFKARFYKGDLW